MEYKASDYNENLLEETLEILKENNKTPKDVLWCGNDKVCFSWEDFEKIATYKDEDFDGDINSKFDFKIVGEDWWIERHECECSEWWEFKTLPKTPFIKYTANSEENIIKIMNVVFDYIDNKNDKIDLKNFLKSVVPLFNLEVK